MFRRLSSSIPPTPWHGSETAAWYWLWSGALCLLVVPAARGYSPLIGWVGYWLVGAPLVLLAALQWRRFLASLETSLAGTHRLARPKSCHGSGATPARHRQLTRRQGRRFARPRVGKRRFGLAALFSP